MVNTRKVGLVFGLFLGGWHVLWALLVALGWAQALYDFVLWMHMIHLPLVIGPFNWMAAITLVVVTFVFGYVIGCVGGWLWNRVHRTA